MDLSNMSLADLRELEKRVDAAIGLRRDADVAAARKQIEDIAKSVGIPVQELVGTVREKGAKAAKGGAGSVAPRYQHPQDPSKKWTGRGRSPKWVKEWTDSGESLEKLLIK